MPPTRTPRRGAPWAPRAHPKQRGERGRARTGESGARARTPAGEASRPSRPQPARRPGPRRAPRSPARRGGDESGCCAGYWRPKDEEEYAPAHKQLVIHWAFLLPMTRFLFESIYKIPGTVQRILTLHWVEKSIVRSRQYQGHLK
ncbi:egl nine homolog 1-like [Dasypus novemcinctus]|uniref:egl nine homolog 1-like n=1 Tax=Dasypus novemcinctus TaxID=9361 RepID=UPI0039C8DD63